MGRTGVSAAFDPAFDLENQSHNQSQRQRQRTGVSALHELGRPRCACGLGAGLVQKERDFSPVRRYRSGGLGHWTGRARSPDSGIFGDALHNTALDLAAVSLPVASNQNHKRCGDRAVSKNKRRHKSYQGPRS